MKSASDALLQSIDLAVRSNLLILLANLATIGDSNYHKSWPLPALSDRDTSAVTVEH
ncbi:hypothetical protein NKJ90_14730 [Mesorhizobium sp. M0051]|uniref:hypothetical protein n=1 Tax=Mesorhizobium sp. M0051 TaxID=2956862 RepID=UPI003339498A